jgi:hypothetical protein
LLALAGIRTLAERSFVKRMDAPVGIVQSIEFRSAKWVGANLPGQRVMLPGSMAAWLNAFADSPQLCGQSYSTTPNWIQQIAQYAVFKADAQYAILWLKAFGVWAVGVSGPHSPEYWRPFAHPGEFEGMLPVLWREDDTTIYAVPLVSRSLAHVMLPEALVRPKPIGIVDNDELRRYVAALDSPAAPASFEWLGTNRAVVRARLEPAQVVSTQVTYDPGWRAWVNGAPRGVYRDGLGFMAVRAECAGYCEIDLDYNGGIEAWLCRAASLGALLLSAAFGSGLFRRMWAALDREPSRVAMRRLAKPEL